MKETLKDKFFFLIVAPVYVCGKFIEDLFREGKCCGILALILPWSAIFAWIGAWLYYHIEISVR